MFKKVLSILIIAGVIAQANAEDKEMPEKYKVEKTIIPELANKCAKKLGIKGKTAEETVLNLFIKQSELTRCIQEELEGGKND